MTVTKLPRRNAKGHTHARHGHEAGHGHHHGHGHDHPHSHEQDENPGVAPVGDTLVIRPASGLSGDMMLAGFARMANATDDELSTIATGLGLPEGCVTLEQRAVNEVNGWGCRIALPAEHSHRTLADIRAIIAASTMSEKARRRAEATFNLLAEAEGRIHGVAPEAVTFHEVGALDSILDTCLCCALFDRISPAALVCGPLPLCDGTVRCSHGLVPSPAPAVLDLLQGVPVRGIASQGETVTPTAIALLKGLDARFGQWPEMTVKRTALIYGTRVLPSIANGALFARGTTIPRHDRVD